MEGKKIYLQPRGTILHTIHDIVELQNAKPTLSDTPNGRIQTRLSMYGRKWDVIYTVNDIGQNRSSVAIEIEGERRNKIREIHTAFALLDAMLVTGAEVELAENEAESQIPMEEVKKDLMKESS